MRQSPRPLRGGAVMRQACGYSKAIVQVRRSAAGETEESIVIAAVAR